VAGAWDFLSNGTLWHALGIVGGVIFFGRFYVQWIASEIAKRSVIPTVFWYMSSVGTVMLLAYAVYLRSPVGALGQSLNIVVYSRNLVHIWREEGRLSPRRNMLIHVLMVNVACVAIGVCLLVWLREYEANRNLAEGGAGNWFWVGVGAAGQALFACRFLVQWLATEVKRKSVVPPAFWHLSVVASLLQLACFVQRAEWVFAVGMVATLLVYGRNLWFIYVRHTNEIKAD
jgi:lipid-A-disaccharide synthase-like uncharacterized protein